MGANDKDDTAKRRLARILGVERPTLTIAPCSIVLIGGRPHKDHRGRLLLDLEPAQAAFWHLIGHEPGWGQPGFTDSTRDTPALDVAEQVFLYAVRTAIDGEPEDWERLKRFARDIDPLEARRADVVVCIDEGIRTFHDPEAPLPRPRDTDAKPSVLDGPPYSRWPKAKAYCVYLVVVRLELIDSAFGKLKPSSVYASLSRTKPGKHTGAGNVQAASIAAELSLETEAFGDRRREKEELPDAIRRVTTSFRKAIRARRTSSKGVPSR